MKALRGVRVLVVWLLVTILFSLSAPLLSAQGTVIFANTSTTRLTTNSTAIPPPGQSANQTGLTTGVNTYLIGLYIAPQGETAPDAFTLVGTATNGTVPVSNGRFNGGTAFPIPGNTGQPIAFQVRAWSFNAGPTYEAARSSGSCCPYLGTSTIGQVTPSTNGTASALFGTSAGQVGGFVLIPGPLETPPSVSITNPTSGSLFAAPANVPVQGRAISYYTSVAYVDLLTNGVFAVRMGSNFNMTLSNLAPGYYTLRAKAVDSLYYMGLSAPVTVRVASPPMLAFALGSNGPIQFHFNSVTGINYVVERGTLTNFSPIITNPGSAGPISYSETNGSATQRTYRVRLQ